MTGEIERIAAGKPAWWRCTASGDPRFTKGVAYEVQEYSPTGRAVIVTDRERERAMLPVPNAEFEPHDPWASNCAHLEQHHAKD